jgi:trimeric autotransporter adhesin
MKLAFAGTAVAIAMGGTALPADKKFAVSADYGYFQGQSAMGLSAQMRLSPNLVANAGIGTGFLPGGVGGRAGLTFAW